MSSSSSTTYIRYWVAGDEQDRHRLRAATPTSRRPTTQGRSADLTPPAAPRELGRLDAPEESAAAQAVWAEDLTIKHEEFHADDDEKFGSGGLAVDARDWPTGDRHRSSTTVEALRAGSAGWWRHGSSAEMAPPAVEQRATATVPPTTPRGRRAIKRQGSTAGRGYVSWSPAAGRPRPAGCTTRNGVRQAGDGARPPPEVAARAPRRCTRALARSARGPPVARRVRPRAP